MGFGLGDILGGVATGGLSLLASGGSNSVIGQISGASSAAAANAANTAMANNANAFSAQQAQQQMDFQERMSDTSYQRAVSDMKAAGINPMLAATNGGASTPGGAMASPAVPDIMPVSTALQGIVSTAKDVIGTYASLKQSLSSSKAADASAINSIASAKQAGVQTDLLEKKGPEAAAESRVFGWLDNILQRVGRFSASHWDNKPVYVSPDENNFLGQ